METKNKTIQISTGLQTVDIVNEQGQKIGEFSFNPTDSNILNRYKETAAWFESIKFPTNEDGDRLTQVSEFCDEISKRIDYIFGTATSSSLFGACGPLTILPNGEFFFEDVLKSVGAFVGEVIQERANEVQARVKKATAKYSKPN